MRPKATTRRSDWVHLGIGAGALLLPPLALGAAFYSMLAAPDEDITRPAVAQAAVPQPAALVPPDGQSTDEVTRSLGRAPVEGGFTPAAPVQAAVTTAATVNPPGEAQDSFALPPAAENPPAATPKRTGHRRAKHPQDPVLNWLQQVGILPRNNGKDGNNGKEGRGW